MYCMLTVIHFHYSVENSRKTDGNSFTCGKCGLCLQAAAEGTDFYFICPKCKFKVDAFALKQEEATARDYFNKGMGTLAMFEEAGEFIIYQT